VEEAAVTKEIGPVEYMIVSFPGNHFKGQILPELAGLVESGTIRIIDLTFVGKDDDGNKLAFEVSSLPPQVRQEVEGIEHEVMGLFSDEDLEAATEALDPGESAALLVWEDLWAARLAAAIRDAGGQLLDLERVPHEVVMEAVRAGELERA
jgi:hypothetical protein